MPLWWLRIQYMMSSNISFDEKEEKNVSNLVGRSGELSLLGYEKEESGNKETKESVPNISR